MKKQNILKPFGLAIKKYRSYLRKVDNLAENFCKKNLGKRFCYDPYNNY